MAKNYDRSDLLEMVCAEVDRHASWIQEISERIMRNPEPGFREWRTAEYVAQQFAAIGLSYRTGLARTGVKARLRGNGDGPTVAILGELDSLIVPGHPFADPETNAAHACGHHAQIASMLGAGRALQAVIQHLDGDVVLFAVPAEECIEIGWRRQLIDDGEIEFLTGKSELIRLGEFDDIDMAMLTHTESGGNALGSVGDTHNGAVIKYVTFTGKSAHAGARPWMGINALKTAMHALTAIDAQSETLPDDWRVRIHSVMTRGGDVLTAVPAEATAEIMIRGATFEALTRGCELVDRCLRGAATSFGARIEVETMGAFMPLTQEDRLTEIVARGIREVVGAEAMGAPRHRTGSTDLGDLSLVMPVSHPRCAGAQGSSHGSDYVVDDHGLAAVLPAKWMARSVVELLADGAGEAHDVIRASGQRLSRDEYVNRRRTFQHVQNYGDLSES